MTFVIVKRDEEDPDEMIVIGTFETQDEAWDYIDKDIDTTVGRPDHYHKDMNWATYGGNYVSVEEIKAK